MVGPEKYECALGYREEETGPRLSMVMVVAGRREVEVLISLQNRYRDLSASRVAGNNTKGRCRCTPWLSLQTCTFQVSRIKNLDTDKRASITPRKQHLLCSMLQ